MGKKHRLAALLSAGAVAVSLSLASTGPAQARTLAAGTGAGQDAAAAPATASCPASDGTQPPAPPRSHGTDLSDVAVVSACDVWAVGRSEPTDSTSQLLIEHWTGGGSWTGVTIPGPDAGRSAELTSVSAVSATDVWAAGEYLDGHATPLILHWDGSAWTPQTTGPGDTTGAVTALPSGEAWAVGGRTILHRDSNGWAPATLPPDPDLAHLLLFGVTATSASNAWAVGRIASTGTPVILHWDGSDWTRNRTLPDGSYSLSGVSAVSATDAWAVGNTFNNRGEAPVTLHWDGSSWKIIASPDPGTGDLANDALRDVTAISASNAWAVGFYTNPTGRSLLLHWDGMNWAQVPAPHSGVADLLFGVAAGPAGTIWTAGQSVDNSGMSHSTAWVFGTVPNVIGDSQAAAADAMNSAGLGATVTSVTTAGGGCGPAANGTIIATTPPAGTFTTPPVTMTFCDFPPVVTVPNVVGLADDQAQGTLANAGLTTGTITLSGNCDFPPGTVIRQNPTVGTSLNRGSAVNLIEATPPKPHGCAQ